MNRVPWLVPKVFLPSSVYLGKNSLCYLRTLKDEINLILASKSTWGKHGKKIEEKLGGVKMKKNL